MDVLTRVVQIVATQLDTDEESLNNDASLMDDLGADSIDMVEITLELESVFGVEIEESATTRLRTIQNITDYIEDKVAAADGVEDGR